MKRIWPSARLRVSGCSSSCSSCKAMSDRTPLILLTCFSYAPSYFSGILPLFSARSALNSEQLRRRAPPTAILAATVPATIKLGIGARQSGSSGASWWLPRWTSAIECCNQCFDGPFGIGSRWLRTGGFSLSRCCMCCRCFSSCRCC